MSDYRRFYVAGGTYFFTIVTHHRRPILTTKLGRNCLHEAIECVRKKRPFEIVAIVLLPDHWHTVLTLPQGDSRYSLRLGQIKETFTRCYLAAGGREAGQSRSRAEHGQRGIWQKRFWEHMIDDEDDLKRCVDYVHWNPKKTWLGHEREGLAVVVVPSFCCGRRIHARLGPR